MPIGKRRRRKQEGGSLLVVVRRSGSNLWRFLADRINSLLDSVVFLSPEDFVGSHDPDFDSWWPNFHESTHSNVSHVLKNHLAVAAPLTVSLVSEGGTAEELEVLLDLLGPSLNPKYWLNIAGFTISASQFSRILENTDSVCFCACSFEAGWWSHQLKTSKCWWLVLDSCHGAVPDDLPEGAAALKSVKYLSVSGSETPRSLRRPSTTAPAESPLKNKGIQPFSESFCRAFWSKRVRRLGVDDLEDASFVSRLTPSRYLSSVSISSPVTSETLAWVGSQPRVKCLTLLWEKGVQLPWGELSKLVKIDQLCLSYSFLTDSDIRELSMSCSPKEMWAYYTDLTPAIWPTVIGWKGIRCFWASSEMIGTIKEEELPESTDLKEVVALNAKTEWFEELFSRYPEVKISAM